MREEPYPDALPAGYRLHWYVLEQVLGQGGFGITYLARDTNLDRPVAIKEYLPSEIARRRSDAEAHPRTQSQAERYTWGLERFLAEARTLARFAHPNIVHVHSVFEANNTAYMVMRFEEGESLAQLLDRCGTLGEQQLMDCLLPILDGLQLVHGAGFIHRDIKPANIYVRQDGSPVLLDFGSARQAFGMSKTMTILVAPGYAPLEQYYSDADTQGAWTDIYSLGATCYRAIAGRAPMEAVARAKGVLGSAREVLEPAAAVGRGRYGERLLAAIDHALQLSEADRPQDVASWRRELLGTGPTSTAAHPASPQPAPAPRIEIEAVPVVPARSASPGWLWPVVGATAALAGVSVLLVATRAQAPVAHTAPAPALALAPPPAPSPLPSPAPSPVPVLLPKPAEAPAPRTQEPSAARVLPAPTPIAVSTARAPASPARPAGPAVSPSAPELGARAAPPAAPTVTPPPQAASPLPAAQPPAQATAPPPSLTATVPGPTNRDAQARSLRNEQIDAAEAALRRGDHAAATQLLVPWAEAGVPRAQVLLGRVKEGRPGREQSNFEAYVWYAIAARRGDAAAAAERDKVAARLQPAEIRQAEHTVEHWRPRQEAAPTNGP